jgi:hypothetical protein
MVSAAISFVITTVNNKYSMYAVTTSPQLTGSRSSFSTTSKHNTSSIEIPASYPIPDIGM